MLRTSSWIEITAGVFFFKKDTASAILLSLVGSGMCIRHRAWRGPAKWEGKGARRGLRTGHGYSWLLYTYDATDEERAG